ncbi:MAG: hypothetical protein DMF16_10595 [Verrucomicrobia bacterium]|nr:MAG: hypothetical protein DMF16_10595 [Verrucomicrobiota bacterium]
MDCGGKRSATPLCSQRLRSPITSPAIPQNYPVRLIDLTFRRKAEQKKRCGAALPTALQKPLPLSKRRAPSLGSEISRPIYQLWWQYCALRPQQNKIHPYLLSEKTAQPEAIPSASRMRQRRRFDIEFKVLPDWGVLPGGVKS